MARNQTCYFHYLLESQYGRYFDELQPGQRFRHWPGRTITDFDDTLFSLLSMNQHPVHIDEYFAAGTQHGRRLVEGPLVISLVIGMSQADVGGRATRTLAYSDVRHVAPVFHGDTIYAESMVVEKSQDGIISVEHQGFNEREELVLSMLRKIVVPRQHS